MDLKPWGVCKIGADIVRYFYSLCCLSFYLYIFHLLSMEFYFNKINTLKKTYDFHSKMSSVQFDLVWLNFTPFVSKFSCGWSFQVSANFHPLQVFFFNMMIFILEILQMRIYWSNHKRTTVDVAVKALFCINKYTKL